MTSLLRENLHALESVDSALAQTLAATVPTLHLAVKKARSGELVPIIQRTDKPIALHSLFDPVKEAQRLRTALLSGQQEGTAYSGQTPGYLVFEGLGGGFHLRDFLQATRPLHCLVLESDLSLLRALLEHIDLTDVLSDPRVHLLLDTEPSEIQRYIRSTYLPAVMGGLLSVPLRSRISLAPGFFEKAALAIRAAIEETADDYTTLSSFGRLWTRNIFANLALLAHSQVALPYAEEAIVTAAGPSLETQVPEIGRLRPGRLLIATDTSLPALLSADIIPDVVLSIDCQNIGYHHFLGGLPHPITLVIELAAPPAVARVAARLAAVSGGHPLSRLVAARLGGIPVIDTSGGNVGHAAVSLAIELGASKVHVAGADFSYPRGKPYARGTFLYSYFEERQDRAHPLERQMVDLMYGNPTLTREPAKGGFLYTTRTLRSYRDRFVSSFDRETVRPLPGSGLPLSLPSSANRGSFHTNGFDSTESSNRPYRPMDPGELRRFLEEYRDVVMQLPDDISTLLTVARPNGSSIDPWSAFASIYPLVARARRDSEGTENVETLISLAKSAVLSMINRAIRQE